MNTLQKRAVPEKAADFAEDADEGREDAALAKIERYMEQCRNLYQSPLISDATRQEYEDRVIVFMRDEATVEQAAQNVQWAKDTLVKAAQAREHFEAKLQQALGGHWISTESAARWMARFNNPQIIEWQREKWLQEEFPAYCTRWKEVALERTRTLERAELYDLDNSDEPGLAMLKNRDTFLALDYDHRKELVARIDALIFALSTNKKEVYRSIRDTVQGAAKGSGACIHSSQVGGLLKEAFAQKDPYAYFEAVLQPMITERSRVRFEYDALERSLAEDVPDGLRFLSVGQFLKLPQTACEAFLSEARGRLALAERERKGRLTQLDAQKKSVRVSMDTKDWDGAEVAIAAMYVVHGTDREVVDMQRFIEMHRADEPEKKNPQVPLVLEQIRSTVRYVPPAWQSMYQESLERGSPSFGKVMEHMYMAVWRVDRQENTLPMLPEAHDTEPTPEEEVVIQRVTAEGEQKEARDAATPPAVLAVANDAQSQVKALDLIEQSDAQAHGSDYNGIVTETVTLKQQRYLVDHVNGQLMQDLRTLEQQGVRFEMAA